MKKGEAKKLNNKIHVIPCERSKQFIENFNKNKPTKEFIESCKKARELFGEENDKSTDQNVADVPIGETVSRAEVLALINKAMFNTNNKDIQDYIFNGLRRDVHNLPSSDRPKGEWIEVTNGRGGHECSNCHAYAPSYMSGDEHLSDFCPNCGCQMIGGDTE